MPAHPDSLQPLPCPRLRRRGWAALAGAAAIVVVTIVAARRQPGWYAERLAARDTAAVDRDARRAVTAVAGLRAGGARAGDWGIAIREEEINAWLATDLRENHAAALPAWLSEPRVRLEPGRVRIAARAGAGPLAGPVSLEIGVRLRSADRLECSVEAARLGVLPLPTGPIAHRLAGLLDRLGFTTEVRRLDGRGGIVVFWGGRGPPLSGLSVNEGEIVVAGRHEESR